MTDRYLWHWQWREWLEPRWTRPWIMWTGPLVTGVHFVGGYTR